MPQNVKICRKRFLKNLAYDRNCPKFRHHCYVTCKCRGVTHNICNLRFIVLDESPVFSHNGSNHDYYFVIKDFANEFKKQTEYLGKT